MCGLLVCVPALCGVIRLYQRRGSSVIRSPPKGGNRLARQPRLALPSLLQDLVTQRPLACPWRHCCYLLLAKFSWRCPPSVFWGMPCVFQGSALREVWIWGFTELGTQASIGIGPCYQISWRIVSPFGNCWKMVLLFGRFWGNFWMQTMNHLKEKRIKMQLKLYMCMFSVVLLTGSISKYV